MELKLACPLLPTVLGFLLIVPYGIETPLPTFASLPCRLLIVPYGIETS